MYKGKLFESGEIPGCFNGEQKNYSVSIVSEQSSRQDFMPVKTMKLKISGLASDQEILSDFPSQQEFKYFRTTIYYPIDELEDKGLDPMQNSPTYRFTDVFNYRAEEYNRFVEKIDEISLPNFYLRQLVESQNSQYEELFAFNEAIVSPSFFTNPNNFTSKYNQRSTEQLSKLKNFLFSPQAEKYGPVEKSFFPLYINMSFKFNDKNTIIEQSDKEAIILFINNSPVEFINAEITEKDFDSQSLASEQLSTYSYNSYLRSLPVANSLNAVKLPEINSSEKSQFLRNVEKIASLSNIEETSLGGYPENFNNIKRKKITGSELLFLKIEKYAGLQATGAPIQSFWFSGDNTNYDIVDTQVKNKKFYTYKIIGYYAINMTSYAFSDYDSLQKTITMTSRSDIKIIESELLTKTVQVLQPLQLPPKVLVSSDKFTNKVYFDLLLERGSEYKPFTQLVPEDQQFVDILNISKQYENPEHSYVYEPAKFEIYRIDYSPNSISDFSDSLITITDRIRDKETHTFIDRVQYDKEYYYLFRAINSENFPSNPTDIYKVSIKQDPDGNVLEVETMNFPVISENYETSKSFTSLIHIFPNEEQIYLRNIADIQGGTYEGKLSEVQVGLENTNPVWDRKFKIRITSNNTGKKMDLNVKFKLKRKLTE